MKDFENKVCYITGGSTGIGLSAARLLAGAGAHVIIFARTRSKLESALKAISSRSITPKQRFAWRQLDVAEKAMVDAVMAEAIKTFGVPDLLINCAGRALPRYFEDITFEQFDETMHTNLYGIWNTISAVVPSMKAKGGCTIVNVSSLAGFMGVFGYTDYCASKFGVIGLSEALRQELRRFQITVAVLCPPDTDTPGLANENLSKPQETKAISGGARIMQPDEVALEMIRGIGLNKFMIIPGMDGKFVYFMKRHFPLAVDFIMESLIHKVQKKGRG